MQEEEYVVGQVLGEILPVYDNNGPRFPSEKASTCPCMLYTNMNVEYGDDNAGETWFSCALSNA